MSKSTYELINEFRTEMNERFDKVESCFVRKEEFTPVKNIVYGMVGFILITVLGSIVALVVVKYSPQTATAIAESITPTVRDIGNTLSSR